MSLRRFSDLPITVKTDEPDFFSQVPADNLTTIKIDQKFDRPFLGLTKNFISLKIYLMIIRFSLIPKLYF